MPELGGSLQHLGIVGINYYWTNQWDLTVAGVPLAHDDPRRVSLHELVEIAWRRYGVTLAITETSHVGDNRCAWLREVAREVVKSLTHGIPVRGVCLYPILGMPEWHDQNIWTRMGLWDLEPGPSGLERRLCEPMGIALEEMHGLVTRSRRDVSPRSGDHRSPERKSFAAGRYTLMDSRTRASDETR
jgi:hypothetical protein